MIVKIFEPNEKPEKRVLLKLVPYGTSVALVAVDEDGQPSQGGYILEITKDGKLSRFAGVNPRLGLSLDTNTRIERIT